MREKRQKGQKGNSMLNVNRGLPVVLLLSLGCASEQPYRGPEYENARKTEALPYTVQVQVNPKVVGGTQPQGTMVPSVAKQEMQGDIERAVVNALLRYRTFAAAYPTTPARAVEDKDAEKADPAWWTEPGVKPDARLIIDITAPAGRELGDVERNGYAWANIFLWLLAGFPGWILEDVEVSPGVQIKYTLVRTVGDKPDVVLSGERFINLNDDEKLNFWNRAGLWQFVQQLIIPPPLVKSNDEVADESLSERYVARVQRRIGESAKPEAKEGTLSREGEPLPVASVINLGGNQAGLFVLSSLEMGQSTLGARPLENWIDLNTDEGKQFLSRADVQAAISRDPALGAALELLRPEAGRYQQGYALVLPSDGFIWSEKESPRKLAVQFRGNPEAWTWTPRLTENKPEA